MTLAPETTALLRHLSGAPGHDEVKADFRDLLVREFGVEVGDLDFEKNTTIIRDDCAVIDHKLYWSAPATEEESQYLCAILNSETTRARAERYQSRGQFGARDFDKVIFNLPIPLFDAKKKLHRDLAAAGAHAEDVAGEVVLVEAERFVAARKRVRRALIDEGVAPRIENLVDKLLSG